MYVMYFITDIFYLEKILSIVFIFPLNKNKLYVDVFKIIIHYILFYINL